MTTRHHKEIISLLEKIPALHKEYINLENSTKDTQGLKSKLSKESYQLKLLNFDAAEPRGAKIKERIMLVGNQLSNAKPDFLPSHESIANLDRYVSMIVKDAVSERIKNQIELLKLLEMQKLFVSLHDFLDIEKVTTLTKYLKEVR